LLQVISQLSPRTRGFLIAYFVLFNAFAVMRAVPVNSTLSENRSHARGDYDRDVYRVLRVATEHAGKPFFEVRNHAIYFDRNPALYLLVDELFVRLGATSPFPMQLLSIVLWNVGLAFCFAWLRRAFASDLAGIVGLSFMLTTPFLLFYSSSIHHEPWAFASFHAALYCFTRFLEGEDQRKWLLWTCAAYFVCCLNYWFYYMSLYGMLIALQVRAGKFSLRTSALLAAVPVLAVVLVIAQVAYAKGGLGKGLFRLADIAAARTVDARIPGSEWHGNAHYVTRRHLLLYPKILGGRIELLMGWPPLLLVALFVSTFVLAGREAWTRYRFMLVAAAAGLSWYVVMVQHSVIHGFAGMYSHVFWMLVVVVFAVEAQRTFTDVRVKRALAAVAIACAGVGLADFYVPYALRYARNIAAGEVVDPRPDPAAEAAAAKKKPKKKQSASKPAVVDAGASD
jgi:hypothetical protein